MDGMGLETSKICQLQSGPLLAINGYKTPQQGSYKWVTGVITPTSGVITLLRLVGAHRVLYTLEKQIAVKDASDLKALPDVSVTAGIFSAKPRILHPTPRLCSIIS